LRKLINEKLCNVLILKGWASHHENHPFLYFMSVFA